MYLFSCVWVVEEELEKIYNDPLDVWQELITDPDNKYLSDEEIKKN